MFMTAFALALVVVGFFLRSTTDDVLKQFGTCCYAMSLLCSVIVRGVTN